MSLHTPFRRKLEIHSDKVKCVDLHPFEPWLASAVYNGSITIYNYKTQSLLKKIDVCNSCLRTCKFVAKKQWIVTAGDEPNIWVYNYNSLEKIHQIAAHTDYVRHLELHPTLPLMLSCSDDMKICLWDIEKNFDLLCTFEGHQHYVMMCRWSPKDANLFASCSLDHHIKFWGLPMDYLESKSVSQQVYNTPFFTLSGHKGGVNCIDFSTNLSLPYIVSGSDDHTVRVWDYQTKLCLQKLTQHTDPVMTVRWHPRLPVIITGAQDTQVHLWHSNLYKLKRTLQLNMGKVWSVTCSSNDVAIGTDSGTVMVQLAGQVPLVSMHANKLVMLRNFDILSGNTSSAQPLASDTSASGKSKVSLDFRNIGSCEFFPSAISHHPNGRFICLCGDSEYVIYTAQGMRSKAFGNANQVVWSHEGHYATLELYTSAAATSVQGNDNNASSTPASASGSASASPSSNANHVGGTRVSIYYDFNPKHQIAASGVYKIVGGKLLGLISAAGISFYNWDTAQLIHCVDEKVEDCWWNYSGTRLALGCAGNTFILGYNPDAATRVLDTVASSSRSQDVDKSGESQCFCFEYEISDCVSSGIWAYETFVYTTASMHLQLYSWHHVETLVYLEQPCHVIGYSSTESRVFLCDEDIYVHPLPFAMLLLHSVIVQNCNQLEAATPELRKHLEGMTPPQLDRASRLLEDVGLVDLALEIATTTQRKFELHIKLGHVDEALQLLEESNDVGATRWQMLASLCISQGRFQLAAKASDKAKLFSNALLLNVATGNVKQVRAIADASRDANVTFLANYMLNDIDKCIDILHATNRHAEATLMARTYKPSKLQQSYQVWNANRHELPKLKFPEGLELAKATEYEAALDKRIKQQGGFPAAKEYAQAKDLVHQNLFTCNVEDVSARWY